MWFWFWCSKHGRWQFFSWGQVFNLRQGPKEQKNYGPHESWGGCTDNPLGSPTIKDVRVSVSVRRVSRSQVTHVTISNCSCSMCAMTVSKLMSTCGNNSCASGGDGRCESNGAFSTGVPVDWGLSQWPARIDCGLSYTTSQATIAQSVIVACIYLKWHTTMITISR